MKKIILIMVVLFVANVACKKTSINGGTTCGCSPVQATELYLVLKNNAGQDLLDSKTTGAFTKDKMEFYRKDSNGKVIPLNFGIRPPFSYGNDKFNFNQLFSSDMGFLQRSVVNTAYLNLGDGKIHELGIMLKLNSVRLETVLIDKKEAVKDTSKLENFVSVFYYNQ